MESLTAMFCPAPAVPADSLNVWFVVATILGVVVMGLVLFVVKQSGRTQALKKDNDVLGKRNAALVKELSELVCAFWNLNYKVSMLEIGSRNVMKHPVSREFPESHFKKGTPNTETCLKPTIPLKKKSSPRKIRLHSA